MAVGGIGKIINLQKSTLYSKDFIRFTINTGIFSPEYWEGYYTYPNKKLPEYPTEPECVIRRRIGVLLNGKDTWYEIGNDSNIEELKITQQYNLQNVILPYFDNIKNIDNILSELDKKIIYTSSNANMLAKLMILGELARHDEAKLVYIKLLNDAKAPSEWVLELGLKYNLA